MESKNISLIESAVTALETSLVALEDTLSLLETLNNDGDFHFLSIISHDTLNECMTDMIIQQYALQGLLKESIEENKDGQHGE